MRTVAARFRRDVYPEKVSLAEIDRFGKPTLPSCSWLG
jgi:hypothetical protein